MSSEKTTKQTIKKSMNNCPEAKEFQGLGKWGRSPREGHSSFSGSATGGRVGAGEGLCSHAPEMGEGAMSRFCARAAKLSLLQPPERRRGGGGLGLTVRGGVWDRR